MTSFQDKALEQAARQLNKFREKKDKPSHERWLDPYSKPTGEEKQKAAALISAFQQGQEEVDRNSFTIQPYSVSITPDELLNGSKHREQSLLDG